MTSKYGCPTEKRGPECKNKSHAPSVKTREFASNGLANIRMENGKGRGPCELPQRKGKN